MFCAVAVWSACGVDATGASGAITADNAHSNDDPPRCGIAVALLVDDVRAAAPRVDELALIAGDPGISKLERATPCRLSLIAADGRDRLRVAEVSAEAMPTIAARDDDGGSHVVSVAHAASSAQAHPSTLTTNIRVSGGDTFFDVSASHGGGVTIKLPTGRLEHIIEEHQPGAVGELGNSGFYAKVRVRGEELALFQNGSSVSSARKGTPSNDVPGLAKLIAMSFSSAQAWETADGAEVTDVVGRLNALALGQSLELHAQLPMPIGKASQVVYIPAKERQGFRTRVEPKATNWLKLVFARGERDLIIRTAFPAEPSAPELLELPSIQYYVATLGGGSAMAHAFAGAGR